jgi:hypothetical protein
MSFFVPRDNGYVRCDAPIETPGWRACWWSKGGDFYYRAVSDTKPVVGGDGFVTRRLIEDAAVPPSGVITDHLNHRRERLLRNQRVLPNGS